jgi:hypothetical protein
MDWDTIGVNVLHALGTVIAGIEFAVVGVQNTDSADGSFAKCFWSQYWQRL